MRDLTAFNQRLQLTFGSDWVARWDDVAKRYAIDSLSAAGQKVSQYWGWFRDANGQPLAPHPVTGLHAYRDLDEAAQEEIVRNLHRSYIGETGDGAIDWARDEAKRRAHNQGIIQQSRKAKAAAFADMIASMDIRRPGWRKDHQPTVRKPALGTPA